MEGEQTRARESRRWLIFSTKVAHDPTALPVREHVSAFEVAAVDSTAARYVYCGSLATTLEVGQFFECLRSSTTTLASYWHGT